MPTAAQGLRTSQRLVFGVDPGTLKMGWAVVRSAGGDIVHVASGVLRPSSRLSRPERLGVMLVELGQLLDQHQPDAVAVETAFVRLDARAALAIGEARGVAVALAAAKKMTVIELSPSEIKRAVVGGGRATKAQVQAMVRVQLSLDVALAEDEADALAAALTGVRHLTLQEATEAPTAARNTRAFAVDAAPMTSGRAFYASVVAQARSNGKLR
jgi:crossover junction endodeoxyribonuclease RuvC